MTSNSQHPQFDSTEVSKTETTTEATIETKDEPLSSAFVPGEKDVIVGRGKRCYNHTGNKELRRIVKSKLDEYSASLSKHDKSYILACIVAQVRKNGGFVKEDPTTGRWYDVGDSLAREKISQTFRDALQDKYRSSTASKRKRRQEKRAKAAFTCMGAGGANNLSMFVPYFAARIQQQYSAMHNSSLSQSLTVLDLESASDVPISMQQQPSFSQSMTALDLESASNEPISMVERLSSSLPDMWFEKEEEDPFQPIPVSETSQNVGEFSDGVNCIEPIRLRDTSNCFSNNAIQISDDEGNYCHKPINFPHKHDTNNNDTYRLPQNSDDPWERSTNKTIESGPGILSLLNSNINIARSA